MKSKKISSVRGQDRTGQDRIEIEIKFGRVENEEQREGEGQRKADKNGTRRWERVERLP